MHTGFWWGNLRERDYLENTGVDGRIMSNLIFRMYNKGKGMDWTNLAQESDRWWALLNAVMNLQVP